MIKKMFLLRGSGGNSLASGGNSLASATIQVFKYLGNGIGLLVHCSDALLKDERLKSSLRPSESQKVSLVASF